MFLIRTGLALIGVGIVAVAVTSCSIAQQPDSGPCGVDLASHLVGQPVALIEGIQFPGTVRVIRPGQAVTMDYVETRINVMLDDTDLIESLRCG